jgi:hypothetical protein
MTIKLIELWLYGHKAQRIHIVTIHLEIGGIDLNFLFSIYMVLPKTGFDKSKEFV